MLRPIRSVHLTRLRHGTGSRKALSYPWPLASLAVHPFHDRFSGSRTEARTPAEKVQQLVPPARFVTRIVDEGLPYGGTWAHALEGEGNSIRVTITEYGEVYNPIFRFISKYIMGPNGTMDGYLTALAKRFGNDVTPVDAPPVPLK
jgi:hypothetical protein